MRRAKVVACLASLMTVLAACSSGSGGSSNGHVTLSYGMWDVAQRPAMKQIIARFHKLHPNIDVQIQLTPWDTYWTKLQTAATGGSAPDVFWMTIVYLKYYAKGGAITDLTSLVKKDHVNMNNYVKAIRDAYTWDGKVYGIPKDVNGFGLCYNKKLFRQAGVKYPDASWTWNDVISAAKKITNKSKGIYGIAGAEADESGWYLTVPEVGGSIISPDGKKSGYDDPATIKGIKFLADLVTKYHVSPTLQQMTDTDPEAMFTSGKIGMYYCGSWTPEEIAAVPAAKKNIDIAPLPKENTRNFYSNGLANVIYSKTKHPKEAWEFVKFLGSKWAEGVQAKTGTVIPAYKGMASLYAKSMPEFDMNVMVDSLPYAKPFPSSIDTDVWRNYATTEFAKAWTGQMSVSQAAKQVAEHMNSALSKEQH